eukprot:COSAG03_NODE_18772_length_348_cov_723.807229_1_plen_50_part_01
MPFVCARHSFFWDFTPAWCAVEVPHAARDRECGLFSRCAVEVPHAARDRE